MLTSNADQQQPESKLAILTALDFLERCDEEKYPAGWELTAEVFRQQTDQQDWQQQIGHLRGQYGKILGRTLELSKPIEDQQNEGQEMLFLIFRSRFEKRSAAELLTMSKEKAHQWRVAGYSIQ